jgi:hypothetical protein
MRKRKISPRCIADHIRRVLKDGGSAPHAEDVQWFFKEEIQSRGWYTAELRRVAVRFRRTIKSERGTEFLIQVANDLFRGKVLEEKVFAVLMLETLTDEFGDPEFRLFESWLDRITSWANHDALALSHCTYACGRAVEEGLRVPLGEIKEPLASTGGLRRPDSGHTAEAVFSRHRAPLEQVVVR